MVIAWVGFASIGIFMARFTRVAFGDKELLGTKVWFTVRYDKDHWIFLVFYNSQQKVSPYNTNTQSTEITKSNEMITKQKQLCSLISLLKSVRRNCKWIFWGFQKRVKWQARARLIAYIASVATTDCSTAIKIVLKR